MKPLLSPFTLSSLTIVIVTSISFNGNPENSVDEKTIADTRPGAANYHFKIQIADSAASRDSIFLADPTIFFYKGTYYLYGTGGDVSKGFLVYVSRDMRAWTGPAGASDGYALVKADTYGSSGFWAPQVFRHNNKFRMAYTANEQIAIAESDSPLGPFKQKNRRPISGEGKQIDPFVFINIDGKKYLYHVRLTGGNKLYVVEMKEDLSDVRPETARECIVADQPWENVSHSDWGVTEGPTVLKHRGVYYLFYSGNDFRNIDYAVGYATANSPIGPWTKFIGNPIISRQNIHKNGTGHGDFIKDRNGDLFYVFHTHRSDHRVSPRITAIVRAYFDRDVKTGKDKMMIDEKTFYYPYVSHSRF